MSELTAQQLFNYANKFARRSESKGNGTQYPTFRQVAKRFKVSYDQIEDAIADGQGRSGCGDYFGAGIGIQIPGVGYLVYSARGEYIVEAEPALEVSK